MSEKKKRTKKKLRLRGVIVILLVLYIVAMTSYYLFIMPVKNIHITGNSLLSENEIIKVINLKENTPIIKLHPSSIKKKLEKLELVNEAKVSVTFKGYLNIEIVENKVLYYDILNSKYVISDGNKVNIDNIKGIPVLVNYVPSKIEDKLVKGLNKVDFDIIQMISEIEYSPDKYEDTVIDEERFILRMNDGNTVYVNMVNIEKLNKYQEIYQEIHESTPDGGTLYLDSNSKNYIFKSYKEEPAEEVITGEDSKKEDKENES